MKNNYFPSIWSWRHLKVSVIKCQDRGKDAVFLKCWLNIMHLLHNQVWSNSCTIGPSFDNILAVCQWNTSLEKTMVLKRANFPINAKAICERRQLCCYFHLSSKPVNYLSSLPHFPIVFIFPFQNSNIWLQKRKTVGQFVNIFLNKEVQGAKLEFNSYFVIIHLNK